MNTERMDCLRANQPLGGRRCATTARTATRLPASPQLAFVEVRSLGELDARLDEQPNSLALVEVTTGNLASVLAWLAKRRQRIRMLVLLRYSIPYWRLATSLAGAQSGNVMMS